MSEKSEHEFLRELTKKRGERSTRKKIAADMRFWKHNRFALPETRKAAERALLQIAYNGEQGVRARLEEIRTLDQRNLLAVVLVERNWLEEWLGATESNWLENWGNLIQAQ